MFKIPFSFFIGFRIQQKVQRTNAFLEKINLWVIFLRIIFNDSLPFKLLQSGYYFFAIFFQHRGKGFFIDVHRLVKNS